jgi:hypothetical protein
MRYLYRASLIISVTMICLLIWTQLSHYINKKENLQVDLRMGVKALKISYFKYL